jgi:peptide/nickel transport system substrate-binding protein
LRLQRSVTQRDEEQETSEKLWLGAAPVEQAVRDFAAGKTGLVLGGDFADLPVARNARLARGALRFDPVGGLFGLVPTASEGPLAEPEIRRLLAQAVDRDALVATLGVPGLVGRATVLEPGLDFVSDPVAPEWTGTPIGERRPVLIAAADRLFGADERPVLRIWAPRGPGAELLLNRLAEDWALLGIGVERARTERASDLKLIDAVAPTTSPAWFLRHFRCEVRPVCDEEVDELLEGARGAAIPAQRGALLAQAAQRIDELQLFLPIAAPVRWSLVSDRIQGFAGNRFGHHSLVALEQGLARQGSQ